MKKRAKFFLIGALFFLAFLLFSYLVKKNLFDSLDFDTTVKLQDNISRRFDGFFSAFSVVGNFEVLTLILVIILALFKKIRVALILPIYAFLHIVEIYFKFFLTHAPPPHFLLRTEKLVEFPQFYVRAVNSYPSGHSARTIFVAVILFFLIYTTKRLSKNLKITSYVIIAVFCIIMLLSRVYLGEHWTTDVVGGGLLGLALAIGSLIFI